MIKKIFFIALIASCLMCVSHKTTATDYKEGDLVFQTSHSAQSKYIALATKSLYTHCGIIINKNNNWYVLEASNVVKITPLEEWKNRGSNFKLKRVVKTPVKIKYKKYLGIKYDTAFKFNNGKYYCSELVYEIYKKQLGITLCEPKKVSTYFILPLKNIMKKRNIDKDQLVVAPCDLL